MAQIKKVEAQAEINCHADKFVDVWCRKTHQVSKMCPHKYPKIELVEGDTNNRHTLGAVITWTYVSPAHGRHEFVKTKVEEVDEERRSVTYKLIDGTIMSKYYKSLKSRIQITPKGNSENNCSIVKWSFEYEKMTEDAPEPNIFFDLLLGSAKDLSAHLGCTA